MNKALETVRKNNGSTESRAVAMASRSPGTRHLVGEASRNLRQKHQVIRKKLRVQGHSTHLVTTDRVTLKSVRNMNHSNSKSGPAISLVNGNGYPIWKRGLDWALIIIASPILIPLMGFIAVMIKLVSRGPILFTQERVGYQCTTFRCYKFRSMHVNSDVVVHQEHFAKLMTSDRPMTKIDAKGDQRMIPFGKLLRSSGLDELPQLINVLKGDMSIVGPRPCIPYEYNNYSAWHKERFKTMPGLTGLWQVSGKNRTTFTRMIQLDIEYAETKSFFGDLGIIFRTPIVLLRQIFEGRFAKKAATEYLHKSDVPSLTETAKFRLRYSNAVTR